VELALLIRRYAEHIQYLTLSYARILEDGSYDAAVIHSGSPKSRSLFDDQTWPLRVTPHFQHWLPLTSADSALVIEPGRKPKLVWTTYPNFWETPESTDEGFFGEHFEIVHVSDLDAVNEHLPSQRTASNARVAFIGEERSVAARWQFADEAVNPQPLLDQLDALRTLKTDYEVQCLEEANRRAARGHAAIAEAFRGSDLSELELHLLFLRATGQDDPETPYKNIVASNENAATLHHVSYRRTPRSAAGPRSLLVDAGATCYGYNSDITRTYIKGQDATASAFSGLLALVDELQRTLCSDIQLGLPYEQLHDRAHDYVANALVYSGIVRTSPAEAVASGLTRSFFPHGLGHSLGLQTHDVGCATLRPRADNPFLRNTTRITERQCFTIEPGIYFIRQLLEPVRQGPLSGSVQWRLVDELGALGGIRIEDDIFVNGGADVIINLTRLSLPE